MKTVAPFIASLCLAGCATYAITPPQSPDFLAAASASGPETKISVIKQNEFPVGVQCFEPYLYVLSLGIIPTHCLDTYRVSLEQRGNTVEPASTDTVAVTSMQGWVALLLMLFPDWQAGYANDIEPKIESIVRGSQP